MNTFIISKKLGIEKDWIKTDLKNEIRHCLGMRAPTCLVWILKEDKDMRLPYFKKKILFD